MSYNPNRTSTSTNVHCHGDNTVTMGFNDHSDAAMPFHVMKLEAGEHTLNVFFRHHDGPNLVEVLRNIVESATAQLEELSTHAWVNAIEELSTEVA
ncbi:hypothetical protein UFOVP629_79 [uncultured Caudovirales phage]|uniref:Uncharacterized protein n=1 Tax=uncultured Caudovirales phage TaxID=2100421 RepID=A0A6J5NBD3_9CAUD|nr:hypothetical protein UFOVP629_79 [uncultured Caudovirales phage]